MPNPRAALPNCAEPASCTSKLHPAREKRVRLNCAQPARSRRFQLVPNPRGTSKLCPTRELHFQIVPNLSIFALCHLSGTAIGLKKPLVSQKNSPLLVPPLSVLIRLPKFVAGTESSPAACNVPTRKFCVVNQCRGAIQRLRQGVFFL